MSRYADRVARLRAVLKKQQLDALIITSLTHLQYLLGFTGTNGIGVFGRRTTAFITDSRYRAQSARQVRTARRYITQHPLLEALAEHGCLKRDTIVGFESHHVTFQQYRVLRRTFPRVTFVPTTGTVEQLLLVKDPAELAALREAMRITDEVFGELLGILKAGMREKDVAAEITYRHRMHGADADAFDPIVAGGERGSQPHARAGDRSLRRGELVTLDFGCTVKGYHSDLTRTVAIGRPSSRAKEIYSIVREAQAAALNAACGGMLANELDGVARKVITDAGYGAAFSHSLGHGLGLHIHERPRVSALSKDTLMPGSVITIEPGIYIPGWGGVRIEDDILLTATGCSVLTTAPRDLLVL
jgi:Xaa-Pro aminopeptidase